MRTRLRILGATTALAAAAVAVPLLTTTEAQAARFTGGNLVVYRVGAGGTALTNSAAPVFLDEFSPAGTKVQSIALPTAAGDSGKPLTAAGQSRSEGLLSRSPDGKYVALTGYDAAPGATGPAIPGSSPAVFKSLTSTLPTDVPRTVGVLDANGIVDTSTVLSAAGAPQIVRSAATLDGDRLFVAGGNGGLLATTLNSGTAGVVAGTAASNLNQVSYAPGSTQLATSGIVDDRLSVVTPDAGTASLTAVPGLPANLLSYGFAFLDLSTANYAGTGFDTLYLANASERAGTIDKYSFDGTTWARDGYVDVPGATGLVADQAGAAVSLAVTTPTSLLLLTDPAAATTAFAPAAPVTLASAPAGTEFRGVALAPENSENNGPSAFVRTPVRGTTLALTAKTIPVTAYVASPSGAVTSVKVKVGNGAFVSATKGAGDLWAVAYPTTGLTAGATNVVLQASGPGGLNTVTRAVVLTGKAAPPPPPVLKGLRAGSYGWNNVQVTRSKLSLYSETRSPTKKGLKGATAGASATVKVVGKSVIVKLGKAPTAGKARITIDGKATVVSLYAKTKGLLTKTVALAGGTTKSHTVTVTVLGTKVKASKGKTVFLVSLQVK